MKKSTKTTDRKKALVIAVRLEQEASASFRRIATEATLRRAVSEMLEVATGEPLNIQTVEQYLEDWLKDRKQESAPKTFLKYSQVVKSFVGFLEHRAGVGLAAINPTDIRDWRSALLQEGRSSTTVNGSVKVLSAAFERAARLSYIPTNPCKALSLLRDDEKGEREAFTRQQLNDLIAAATGTDWEGAIWFGFSTGLRLRDICNLEWSNINREEGTLRIKTQKTGKVVVIPIHERIREWLNGREIGIGAVPIFPSLRGRPSGGKSGLSGHFKSLMKRAGVEGRQIREGGGLGRKTSSLSFHSLRHTFVSLLANSGVSSELRMKLAGHSSREAHEIYTHIEYAQLQSAIDSIDIAV